jgi:hypothetical protein
MPGNAEGRMQNALRAASARQELGGPGEDAGYYEARYW